jgi:hypothetical protein
LASGVSIILPPLCQRFYDTTMLKNCCEVDGLDSPVQILRQD